MKAVLRVGSMLGAVLMAAAPMAALAQVATMPAPSPPTSNSASPDTVGPTELQNFNLRGTVTRPAEQAPVPAPATRAAPAQSPSQTSLPVRAPQARTAQRASLPERKGKGDASQAKRLTHVVAATYVIHLEGEVWRFLRVLHAVIEYRSIRSRLELPGGR